MERTLHRTQKEEISNSYRGFFPDYKKWNWCSRSNCTCNEEKCITPTVLAYKPQPPSLPLLQQQQPQQPHPCPCISDPSSVSWNSRKEYLKRREEAYLMPPQFYSLTYNTQKIHKTSDTLPSRGYCQLCEDEKKLRFIQAWKKRMMLPFPPSGRLTRQPNLLELQPQYSIGKINKSKRSNNDMVNRSSDKSIKCSNRDRKGISIQQECMGQSAPSNLPQKKHQIVKQMRKKKFQCSYCEKSFAKSSHLRDHHRTHSGERPFVCKFCGKAFSQFSNLRTHLRIHTGEKPFQCNICQKAFTQRVTLRSHIRTHNI